MFSAKQTGFSLSKNPATLLPEKQIPKIIVTIRGERVIID